VLSGGQAAAADIGAEVVYQRPASIATAGCYCHFGDPAAGRLSGTGPPGLEVVNAYVYRRCAACAVLKINSSVKVLRRRT